MAKAVNYFHINTNYNKFSKIYPKILKSLKQKMDLKEYGKNTMEETIILHGEKNYGIFYTSSPTN
jgi:hypothetical protein